MITNFKINIDNIKLGSMPFLNSEKESNIEREINILLTPDNNYVIHCSVVMASVLMNCDKTSNINFYITDGGLSKENKSYLKDINKIRNCNVYFLDITKYNFSNLPLNRPHIKVPSTYFRLLVCEILPKDIEKILYLDCDVIVEQDLKELWDIKIDKYLAGVVEDETAISNSARLGINFYFNSGVILFNITELRKFNLYKKCINYFNKNKGLILLQDQDILNGVLNNKCLKLPLNWNVSNPIFKNNSVWKQQASFHEKIKAQIEPKIIHYTYIPKPWNKNCNHPLRDEYFKYLKIINPNYYKKIYRYKKLSEFIFQYLKNDTHSIIIIMGIKFKIKRKNNFRILKDELESIQYELMDMKQKIQELK